MSQPIKEGTKNFLVQVVLPIALGLITVFSASRYWQGQIDNRIEQLEQNDIRTMNILHQISENQILLSEHNATLKGLDGRINSVETAISAMVEQMGDRYTRREADKDNLYLQQQINNLKN